jgi:hypothetical protein
MYQPILFIYLDNEDQRSSDIKPSARKVVSTVSYMRAVGNGASNGNIMI